MKQGRAAGVEFGAFLRTRRAAVTPDQVGVQPSYGDERRVPGLRREEIAALIGVSHTYYTRLEQGESHQVSDSVLASIARVLRLTADERAHLYRLARQLPPVRAAGREDRVREPILDLIAASTGAAVLVGRCTDILAGNPRGYALWDLKQEEIDRIGTEDGPNQARRVFLDPAARTLFSDWERQAQDLASYLRLASAERPDDLHLHRLIGELSRDSSDFADIWARHPVQDCVHTVRRYHHPRAGDLTVNEEILRLPDDPGQRLIISTPEAGSVSAQRFAALTY
jgi:transcriptional regulator with XRE-family HTH domain